jgi:hypothetical protein
MIAEGVARTRPALITPIVDQWREQQRCADLRRVQLLSVTRLSQMTSTNARRSTTKDSLEFFCLSLSVDVR